MPKGKSLKVVFKQDHSSQGQLFPINLDDLVPADHPVWVVSNILDNVSLKPLYEQYKGGGRSSYHPRVLLKALVFAYINNIYSSRKIEEALKQNVLYMWLCGMNQPDHNTINRFRGVRLQKTLEPIFAEVVQLLCTEGLLSIKDLYTDGTKIEANANRYSFVWGKSIKHNREKITQQLKELWDYAKSITASEMDDSTDPDGFEKIDGEKVKQTIAAINEVVSGRAKEVPAKVKQKLAYGARRWPSALDKYEEQERIMGTERNSYSKTDPDATFMRMKEDHMGNGQLKPAYNLQISTNNQYVTTYSIHHHTTDTNTLAAHLQQHVELYKQTPQSLTADAGYGSEQNYQMLEQHKIDAFVKHNQFDRSGHGATQKKYPFTPDKLHYNAEQDYYVCPMGQPMHMCGTAIRITAAGFKQTTKKYRAQNCTNCPLRGVCHKSQGNRTIEVNENLIRLKAKADQMLKSPEGIERRKKRCFDVEPVFANLKHNHHFKRFMLRGKSKVTVEIGLLALAHNLRKRTA